jgi:hypothetical protein
VRVFVAVLCVLLFAPACSTTTPVAPDRTSPVAARSIETADRAAVMTATASPAQTLSLDVGWTLTKAQCPSLWSNSLTGQGVAHLKFRFAALGDGTSQISVTQTVHGTATDEEAHAFVFNYANTFQLRDGAASITNSFNVVGPSGASLEIHAGSTSILRAADGDFTGEQHGPLECVAI